MKMKIRGSDFESYLMAYSDCRVVAAEGSDNHMRGTGLGKIVKRRLVEFLSQPAAPIIRIHADEVQTRVISAHGLGKRGIESIQYEPFDAILPENDPGSEVLFKGKTRKISFIYLGSVMFGDFRIVHETVVEVGIPHKIDHLIL
jgi:hypothetical protein